MVGNGAGDDCNMRSVTAMATALCSAQVTQLSVVVSNIANWQVCEFVILIVCVVILSTISPAGHSQKPKLICIQSKDGLLWMPRDELA
jgi:hypothetical protein